MTKQNWNFDVRDNNQPIEYEGGASEICEGCTVDLLQDGVTIAVQVQANKAHTWTGEITGFPDTNNKPVGQLKLGTTIQFQDKHVFRCAA